MSWGALLGGWEPTWVVETLLYLPPACRGEGLALLGPDCHPSADARAAVERVRDGGDLEQLRPWSRPPWQRLLQAERMDLLAQALDGPWNWEVAPLLAGVATERLRELPDTPGLRHLLSELGAGPSWEAELVRWLEEGRRDWERFAEPENQQQQNWLLVARYAPERHPLLARALAGEAEACLELEDLLDPGPDTEEAWWQELLALPLHESSNRLRARLAEGWQPRRRWSLFIRLRALVAPGELRTPGQNWRPLIAEELHWFQVAGERMLACGTDGALHVYDWQGKRLLHRHFQRELRWGKVWEAGAGLLVYDGQSLTFLEADGAVRWEQACCGAVACEGGRVAVLEEGQLRLFRLEDGRQVAARENPQQPPPLQKGPLFMLVDDSVQQLAWSPDGRWLASSHQNKVFLWDAETTQPLHCWEHQASVSWLGFLRDKVAVTLSASLGNTIMVGLRRTFFLYDPRTGENLYRAEELVSVDSVKTELPWIALGSSVRTYWLHWEETIRECGWREARGAVLTSLSQGILVLHTPEPIAELIDLRRGEGIGSWPGFSQVQLGPWGALGLRRNQLHGSPAWDDRPVADLEQPVGPSARAYVEALRS